VVPRITQRILIKALSKMKNDDLVNRKTCPQVPPKVEYSLIKKGDVTDPDPRLAL
jgi:DNA-binding HxlR family transcriptional regulator